MIQAMDARREGSRTAAPFRARLGLTLCAALAASLWTAGPLSAQQPLHTKNPKFRIPFQFNTEEMRRLGAVEVQLHVSSDQGRSWSLSDSVSPSSQKFAFEAQQNGEYWFAVRTIDGQRRSHPGGPLQPGLIVVVDDLDPVLKLDLSENGAGDVRLTWEAIDDHLDPSTLRLEYLDSPLGAWQPIPATPAAAGVTSLAAGSGELMVRGSVADKAGNSTLANASLTQRRAAHPARGAPAVERPDFREPVAAEQPMPAEENHLATASTAVLPNMPHAPVPTNSLSSTPSGSDIRSPLTRAASVSKENTPAILSPSTTASSAATSKSNSSSAPFTSTLLPADARRVNSRSFRIGYAVQDVGPSGVGSVDAYITENGGGKWFHYGTDADRQSPFDIVVPRDGAYGFAIRVRNGIGIVDDPPQPGQSPDFLIIVDQTAPSARLMPLSQSSNGGVCSVQINWTAQDDRLSDRPIALFQGMTATGPWEPITGWMANTGRYDWLVTASTPSSVFVRLDARDEAGNVTSVTTDRPLVIDTNRPTARILDVESVHAPGSPR